MDKTDSFLDLKPENVLICIDDVETIIQAELAASANAITPPTKLVGVPPSRGRGGNQTPRSESVFITGSQPLPSPSSSYGQSPMLDKWAFGMSKIDPNEPLSKPGSLPGSISQSTSENGQRGLSAEMDRASEGISQLQFDKNTVEPSRPDGPSLLSQQAPSHANMESAERLPITNDGPPLSAAEMPIDAQPQLDGSERITVKIADLGNG
jgi:serine/threonine-protein kinase SRPK3